MGIIVKQYLKQFLCRYDKDENIPYLSFNDFEGLKQIEKTFINSRGLEIHYYSYFYDNHEDKVLFFCPGIGPGHTAYLREIEEFAKRGFVVYSIDYTGCDKSRGESMLSIYQPTRDVDELLNILSFKDKFVLVGHSLGAFTALNLSRIRNDISKTVVISGFLSPELLLSQMIKKKFILNRILKYENELNHEYVGSNLDYLVSTTNKLMFIHSKDDPMVSYSNMIDNVQPLKNDNLSFFLTDKKRHNPQYALEALQYMFDTFSAYYRLVNGKKIDEAKEFMKDKSAFKMTDLDEEVINAIMEFIK